MAAVYLAGVDGSPDAERALEYAGARALANQGKVLVAYVIEWSKYGFNTAEENAVRHKRREEELVRARTSIVDPLVERLRSQGVAAEGLIRHGHAAETLDQLAREHQVTCIVVGRQGQSGLRARLFGSVGVSLVQIADRPVTVVP